MKKLLSIVAVMALCAAPVMADTLELRVVADETSIPVGVETTVGITIEGQLVTGDTDGLALFGVNLTASGDVAVDLCDTAAFLVTAPAALSEFDRNEGLTNPPDMAASGFSGTCDGANGLWQIGGGQNTIGNTGPTLYPVGSVETGVCNSGWTVLAEGTITLTLGAGEEVTLTLDTGFANTLDTGTTGTVYPVTAATVTITDAATIGTGVDCLAADVNCDGVVSGLDIGVVTKGTNWGLTTPADPRADVNGDGTVSGLDIGAITVGTAWGQSTGPCNCN